MVSAYVDSKEKLDAVLILSSEDGKHPFPLFFPSEEHVSRHDFASPLSVLSCLSAHYCQLCFLVSLFSVSLCLVLYLEITGQVSLASPIPLDFILQYFKDFQKKANISGDTVFPVMMPHLPPGPG